MPKLKKLAALAVLLSMSCVAADAWAADSDKRNDTRTNVTIYVWATSVEEEFPGGAKAKASFSTIFDNLDFAFMGELVQRRGDWIYGVGAFYADISESGRSSFPIQNTAPNQPSSIDTATNFKTKTEIFNGFIGYRLVPIEKLDLYGTAGIRFTRFDTRLIVDAVGQSFRFQAKDDMTDAVAGLRGAYRLTPNWSFPFIADVGTGDSDLTWQAFAGTTYSLGHHAFTLGYRHMYWDISGTSRYLDSVDYDGPLLGYTYRF
ncbi:hypothetical protein V5738_08785 [Salinisphaera sp. SPP-AMP-43]|uniref:hypothetical protein n=1 Tax=Salinisphaera sp. SPP-AMP-43 TaxID=3121288 RepID=UPI003C6E9C6C